MTNEDYKCNVERLKEIEELVKKPEVSMDKIDDLISETKKLVTDCYAYTRGLKSKVEVLNKIDADNLEPIE